MLYIGKILSHQDCPNISKYLLLKKPWFDDTLICAEAITLIYCILAMPIHLTPLQMYFYVQTLSFKNLYIIPSHTLPLASLSLVLQLASCVWESVMRSFVVQRHHLSPLMNETVRSPQSQSVEMPKFFHIHLRWASESENSIEFIWIHG